MNRVILIKKMWKAVIVLPRGKKTPPDVKYRIMLSWAVTDNFAETARALDLPVKTVEKVVKDNRDKEEFKILLRKKREEMAENATRIMNKVLKRLEQEIDDEEKDIPINHLTTAFGTLYDKKALMDGKSTVNVGIVEDADIEKLAEVAGYVKRK